MFCNVSIWALLVSTIASLLVVTAWYSDYVLGKKWRSYMGNLFTTQPSTKSMIKMFVSQFALTLITNFILARALFYADATTWTQGVAVAIALWIAFIATVEAGTIVWEKKPWKLAAINSGAYLVTFIVSAIILTVW
ncbi:MAG: DUF1761 domain-containing protein [Candidatus Pacebacteria bacterium]|nr:DUF1761 domain-containing protein [Candidatus Paceibacterota bacterium]